MSRYTISAKDEKQSVVVGWDNPLQTFFGQVEDLAATDEETIIFWIGVDFNEVSTLQQLVEGMAAYAIIPQHILDSLSADHAKASEPSPLQQMVSDMMH